MLDVVRLLESPGTPFWRRRLEGLGIPLRLRIQSLRTLLRKGILETLMTPLRSWLQSLELGLHSEEDWRAQEDYRASGPHTKDNWSMKSPILLRRTRRMQSTGNLERPWERSLSTRRLMQPLLVLRGSKLLILPRNTLHSCRTQQWLIHLWGVCVCVLTCCTSWVLIIINLWHYSISIAIIFFTWLFTGATSTSTNNLDLYNHPVTMISVIFYPGVLDICVWWEWSRGWTIVEEKRWIKPDAVLF